MKKKPIITWQVEPPCQQGFGYLSQEQNRHYDIICLTLTTGARNNVIRNLIRLAL